MTTTTQTVTYRCPHCQQPVDVDLGHENELLVCPNENCKKPFKVEVPTAQPAPDLILPPGVKDEQVTAQAAVAAPAPVAQPASEVPEETRLVVHLRMFRRYPFRASLYTLVVLAGAVGTIYFWADQSMFLALLCLLIGGLTAYRLVIWWLRMRGTKLVITNKRCILETGIVNQQVVEVPLHDIEDIHVQQRLLHRLLNVGDLIIHGKKKPSENMVVMAVPSPREVATAIRDEPKA